MKKSLFILILFFVSCTYTFAQEDWARTYYLGPVNDSVCEEDGYLFDGTFYYNTSTIVNASYSAYLFAYSEYQPVIPSEEPPIVVSRLENMQWLEVYEWKGSNPPHFFWKWVVKATHTCFAKPASKEGITKGEVRIDARVKAVDSDYSLKTKNGVVVNRKNKKTKDKFDNKNGLSNGTLGVKQAIDSSHTSGPFKRFGIINSAYAISEVMNKVGYEKSFSHASLDITFSTD